LEISKKTIKVITYRWRGYLVAIGLVALATWLKYLAQPDIIAANIPILYIAAIVPVAIFYGFGPSILVCILSLLAYDYFFVPPLYTLGPRSIQFVPILVIFLLVGLSISYLTSNLRKKNEEASREITTRKQKEAELAKYKDHLEEMVKRRTTELRESEQRWSTTLASVGDGVIATDVVGNITFINPVAEILTGWTLRESITKPIAEVFNIINEQTRQKVENPVARVIEKGIVVGLANHTILIRKDGTEVPIGDSGAPIKNEEGNTTGVVLVFRDISEQKKTEEVIEASEIRYRRLFEAAKDGILILEFPSGKITSVNPFLIDLLGYTQDEVVGKQLWEIGAFKDILASKEAFHELQDKSYIRYEDLPLETKDGRHINVEFVSNVYPSDHTKVIQCNIRDITERKKTEEKVKLYTSELEIANKELESFSYSVSHDLRAPLRTLDGFSEMVIENYGEKLDETGKDYLNRIRVASQTMSQLINDMLKLSRITRAEIIKDTVNLSDMAQSIYTEILMTEPDRQAEFIIAHNVLVNGDRQLLQILMRNLLDNAWKFTNKTLQTRLEFGENQQTGKRVLFIKDNGAGFDTKYSDRLFQPFQRLHSSEEYAGTGIGLAIVQRVVQRHGGHIWAESEINKGATFYFTLE
jgi:PAS domain S-box-containing protein